jgi:hypothetical protein
MISTAHYLLGPQGPLTSPSHHLNPPPPVARYPEKENGPERTNDVTCCDRSAQRDGVVSVAGKPTRGLLHVAAGCSLQGRGAGRQARRWPLWLVASSSALPLAIG